MKHKKSGFGDDKNSLIEEMTLTRNYYNFKISVIILQAILYIMVYY